MPTYEYACTACGNQWEELQKISEPALEDCPKCAAKTAKRLISAGNFILKGGGWYADLYSSKPAKSGGSGDAPAPSKDAGDAAKTPAKSGDAAPSPAAPAAPTPAAAKPSTGASGGSGGSSST